MVKYSVFASFRYFFKLDVLKKHLFSLIKAPFSFADLNVFFFLLLVLKYSLS